MKLSKREMILLIVLAVFAIAFIEYQLGYIPLKAKYDKLVAEDQKVQSEVDEINRIINGINANKTKKIETLQSIKKAADPFFDQLNADALLRSTHDMVVASGLQYTKYGMSDKSTKLIPDPQKATDGMVYQLNKLAEDYAAAASTINKAAVTPTPTPASNSNNQKTDDKKTNEIESIIINVDLTGNYEQLRQFISSLESQKKTIQVSALTIDGTSLQGLIDVEIKIQYFGIRKLEDSIDKINQWNLSDYNKGSGDPFFKNIPPTPIPTRVTNSTAR